MISGFRLTIRINDWMQKRIEVACVKRDMTISDFIRYCIKKEIEREAKNEKN